MKNLIKEIFKSAPASHLERMMSLGEEFNQNPNHHLNGSYGLTYESDQNEVIITIKFPKVK